MQSIYKRSSIGFIFLLLGMNFFFVQSAMTDAIAEAENGVRTGGVTIAKL